MRFGEYFIGIGKGSGRSNVMNKGSFNYLYTFPTLKFLMERPDNGLVVVENQNALFHESKSSLVPLDGNTESILEKKINRYYDSLVLEYTIKRDADAESLALKKDEVERLESQISHLTSLNEGAFTQNREIAIRQLSKALRKGQRRMQAVEKELDKTKEVIQYSEKQRMASISLMRNQVKGAIQ